MNQTSRVRSLAYLIDIGVTLVIAGLCYAVAAWYSTLPSTWPNLRGEYIGFGLELAFLIVAPIICYFIGKAMALRSKIPATRSLTWGGLALSFATVLIVALVINPFFIMDTMVKGIKLTGITIEFASCRLTGKTPSYHPPVPCDYPDDCSGNNHDLVECN